MYNAHVYVMYVFKCMCGMCLCVHAHRCHGIYGGQRTTSAANLHLPPFGDRVSATAALCGPVFSGILLAPLPTPLQEH